MSNLILATDSYKLTHHRQYPANTEAVYSYFESRSGAQFKKTLFFGLQSILKQNLVGPVVSQQDVDEASMLAGIHFGDTEVFNREGWQYIVDVHGGLLPVKIKAVRRERWFLWGTS